MYILVTVAQKQPQLTLADIIFFTIILSLLTIETIADEQQWRMFSVINLSLIG
jgi:steroid 5-alpha reductase family enzyme